MQKIFFLCVLGLYGAVVHAAASAAVEQNIIQNNFGNELYVGKADGMPIAIRFDIGVNRVRIDTDENRSHHQQQTHFPYVASVDSLSGKSDQVKEKWQALGIRESQHDDFFHLTISKTSKTTILSLGVQESIWNGPFEPLRNAETLDMLISKREDADHVAKSFTLYVDGYAEPIQFKRWRSKKEKARTMLSKINPF